MQPCIVLILLVACVTSQKTAETQCTQDSETQRQLVQLMEMFQKFSMEVTRRLDDLQTYADEPKLVGFWPLSEPHEGKDLSGYGNDIQFNNVIFEKACDSCQKTVAFKGVVSSYGLIPGGGVLDVQRSFTWMAWLYPESLQNGPLFDWTDPLQLPYHGTHIWIYQNGFWFGDKDFTPNFRARANLKVGQWNKVAISYHYSSGAIVMYVNGEEEWFDKGIAQTLRRTEGAVTMGARTAVTSDTRAAHARLACMRLYQGKAAVSLVEETPEQCPQIQGE